nr:hypothetical protein Hi04_10k_c5981_00009 [uncultured bacterium]
MDASTASVVIPSAGDAASLQRCLASLKSQNIEGDIEVVVVLDGVVTARAEGIRQLRSRDDWPWPIRWVEQSRPAGPGAARNRGADEAHGRYLIFLDDDMDAEPGFVLAHLELLAQNPNEAVVGAIITRCSRRSGVHRYPIESFWKKRYERLAHHSEVEFWECFSGNLAMARETFRRIGGFDESLPACEDIDLGIRLLRAGVRLLYGARALATQDFVKSPSEVVAECEAHGTVHARLWRKYPETRNEIRFSIPFAEHWNARWLRKWALNARWRADAIVYLLPKLSPWLPGTRATMWLEWFPRELATARGAQREFADPDRWTALSEGTVVLCYHKFSPAGGPRSEYEIPIDLFARQIDAMLADGWRFVTMRDWLEARKRGEVIRGRSAIVTIDDGADDLLELAAPVLRERKIPAVLYVVRDWIGVPGCLSAAQIKSLAREGWEFGAHSLSHPHLPKVAEHLQREEIFASRVAMAELTGEPPLTFAYPYGDSDATSRRLAQEAGYAAAMGVEFDCAYPDSPQFDLPRFSVDGRWPLWRFKLLLLEGIMLGLP